VSCIHISMLWWLSTEFVPVKHIDHYPAAVMLSLSTEPEFTQNSEQNPVVGVTQDFSEPEAKQPESEPKEVSDLLTASERPDARLIVEKERAAEPPKKELTKVKQLQQKVIEPRKPVIEETSENRSEPLAPAVTTSTTLSGQSQQISAAANSDSLHKQHAKINWRSRLQGHLMGFKRYPPSARKQRQQGTATVRFVVNKDGNVLSAQLFKSSGVAVLDNEALALIKRAQPLPSPPAGLLLHGQITLTLPIDFELKKRNR
jgi:periplasmic protein TonB